MNGSHLVRPPVVPPPPGARAPVLLLLHGLGGTEHLMFGLRHHLAPEFVVVSLQGLLTMADAPDHFRPGVRFGRHARGWFHTHATPTGRRADPAEARGVGVCGACRPRGRGRPRR